MTDATDATNPTEEQLADLICDCLLCQLDRGVKGIPEPSELVRMSSLGLLVKLKLQKAGLSVVDLGKWIEQQQQSSDGKDMRDTRVGWDANGAPVAEPDEWRQVWMSGNQVPPPVLQAATTPALFAEVKKRLESINDHPTTKETATMRLREAELFWIENQ